MYRPKLHTLATAAPIARCAPIAFRALIAWLLTAAAPSLLAQDSSFVACFGDVVRLTAPAGYDYDWSPKAGISPTNRQVASFMAVTDATYTVDFRRTISGNLVKNGDFELGNVDFTTAYRYVPGGTFDRGTYATLVNPQSFNIGFAQCLDSATPGGKVFVADGSEVDGTKVWCQTVPVEPGRRYAFRIYLTSLVAINPPQLVFTINGNRLGPAQALTRTCDWQQFYTIWQAPNVGTAEICVVNTNTGIDGNDFAMDRISFVEVSDTLRRTYSVTVAQPARDTLNLSLCPGQRYRDNGLDLGPGESGQVVLKTSLGCDSTVVVRTVAREPIFVSERADTLCPGDVLDFQGVSILRDTTICRSGLSQFGCDSTFCLTVKFFDETALAVAIRRPSCVGDTDATLTLGILAGRPPFDVLWENGSTDTVRTGLPQGDYAVTVIDRLGCTARRTVTVQDPPPIAIQDFAIEGARCFTEANGNVVAVPSGGTGPFVITVRDTVRAFDAQRLSAGTYTLRATDSLGCFAERPFTIDSPPPVVLDLRGDTLIRLGQTASFRLNISGDSVFTRWDFNLQPIDSLVRINAVALVPTGTGQVRVVGTDRNGCSAEVGLVVRVKSGERPYFPTAFSPNDDGVNDRFGPVRDPAIARVEVFQVYDRWGGLVFTSSNCGPDDRSNACEWDGRASARKVGADPGVYVYVARLQLIDGRVIEQAGDVTLVR